MTSAPDHEFLLSGFLMDAWDGVAVIEDATLPGAPSTDAALGAARRVKGAATSNDFPGIAALAGAIEDVLVRLPSLAGAARAESLHALGAGLALLKNTLDDVATGRREDARAIDAFVEAQRGPSPAVPRALAIDADVLEYFGPETAEHLEAMTCSLLALESDGFDTAEIHRFFRAVHTLKGAAYTVGARVVGDLAHGMEDLLVAVRDERLPLTTGVVEALFAGIDAIHVVLTPDLSSPSDAHTFVETATRLLATVAAPGHGAPPDPDVPEVSATALTDDSLSQASTEERRQRPSIRVHAERLEGLARLIGELVTSRSRLERRLDQIQALGDLLLVSRRRMARAVRGLEAGQEGAALPVDADLDTLARSVAAISSDLGAVQDQLTTLLRSVGGETDQVQSLTEALRREGAQARQVPVGRLFARFGRQVRDLARAEGKAVTLEVSGETVEVDHCILEALADPLLHLVLNAIAHGFEPEAERRACGKPPLGTLRLRALQRGAFVEIEVADDGRGIDIAALPARAVAQGLISPEVAAHLSHDEALELIFVPGFSTSPVVTTVAGRGIGMDVVRTNVSRLTGEVDIDTSPGVGTRFVLRLPLTVTIIEALMVRAGGQTFALPLSAVRRMLELRGEEIRRTEKGEIVTADGEAVVLVDLAEALGLPPAPRERVVSAVMVRAGHRRFALAVDALLGPEEVVVTAGDEGLAADGPFSGTTISSNGGFVPILDPARCLETSRRRRGSTLDAAARPAPTSTETPRVLLVDDSVSVRRFVGQTLERAGFQVTLAGDGAEALALVAGTSFDLVVTDLEMPRVNGYELIRDLRQREATRDLPIVVVTTRADRGHADLAEVLGVQRYITKSVDPERLVPILGELVHGEAAAR